MIVQVVSGFGSFVFGSGFEFVFLFFFVVQVVSLLLFSFLAELKNKFQNFVEK